MRYRRPARLGDDLQVVSASNRSAHPRSTFISEFMRGAELLTDARSPPPSSTVLGGRGGSRANGSRNSRPSRRIDEATFFTLSCCSASPAPAHAQQPAATVIAVPPLTSPDSGNKGNEMLAVGWDVTQAIEADLRQTAEVMPLKPNRDGLLFLSRGHRADLFQVALGRREGVGHRLRPVALRRAADRRLLRLRRRQGPRARPQGLCRRRPTTGAAPRTNARASPTPR